MVRLQRVGRKHEPVFRLVLTDSKNSPKSGKFLDILGSYDARRGDKSEFNAEKIKNWMAKGAKVSDTVHNLLIDKKIITGKKINNLPKKLPIVSEKVAEEPKSAPAEAVAPTSTEPTETETAPEPEVVAEVAAEPTPEAKSEEVA